MAKITGLKRLDAIMVSHCPQCGAKRGKPCMSKGEERKSVHRLRMQMAQEISEKSKAAPPLPDNFYSSWEWKRARYEALRRNGRVCGCCGWSPDKGGDNYLVVDHIKPIRLHPELALDPKNHQVLCNDCNMGKSYRYQDDFRS